MKYIARYRLAAAVAAIAAAAGAVHPAGSAEPPIKIVLPVPSGGAGDIVARLLADQVGRTHDRSFVIETRPGAGTMIGTEAVVRARADGNTLLMNAPFLLIGPHLRKVSFDPLTGLAPICHLVSSPGVIAVHETSPYRTFDDLMNAVRGRPGELTFASAGPGTTHHIGFEKLKQSGGLDFVYVPFPGGGPAINALLGNHVTAVLAEYAPLSEHLKSGRLRALATTANSRIPALPDLPTVAETYNGFEVDFWWGLFAPAQTPQATLKRLAEWFTEAMGTSDLAARLTGLGFYPSATCGAPFAELLRQQFDDYGRVIRDANVRPE